jgi:hypothetical protein
MRIEGPMGHAFVVLGPESEATESFALFATVRLRTTGPLRQRDLCVKKPRSRLPVTPWIHLPAICDVGQTKKK